MPFFLASIAVLASACATESQHRIPLTHVGGSTFSFAPFEKKEPPEAIECEANDPAGRFNCFVAEHRERFEGTSTSASMAVVIDGKLLTASVGTIDASDPRPVTAGSTFAIGSVSKIVLALATVRLAEEGKLDLDAPIRTYLPRLVETPGAAAALGDVSLRQLLTHTAGMPVDFDCASASDDLARLVLLLDDEPLWAPSGEAPAYSNAGFAVIAAVLEAVTGEPFEHIVTERVLEPLAMSATRYGSVPQNGGEHVVGHDREGHRVGNDSGLCRAAQPSGGLIASTGDLARLTKLLLARGEGLLGAQAFDAMVEGVESGGVFEDERYGFGIKRFRYKGVTVLGHDGLLPHFSAFAGVVPERGFGISVVVNRAGPALAVALAAIDAVLALPEGGPSFAPLKRPLEAFVGCYVAPSGGLGVVAIRREDSELIADMVGPARSSLPPLGTFFPLHESRATYLATVLGIARRVDPSMCESKGESD